MVRKGAKKKKSKGAGVEDLSAELKTLNEKVSSLLALFEEASKSFKEAKVKGRAPAATGDFSEIMEKMEALENQNRTIARGLLMLEKIIQGSKSIKPTKLVKLAKPRKRIAKKARRPRPRPEPEPEPIEEEEETEYESGALPDFSF